MESNDRDKLESILDDALPGYSAADPLAGIEKRVLQRIGMTEATRRGSRILGWAAAFPILISMWVLAIAVWLPHPTQPAHTGSGPPRPAPAQPIPAAMTLIRRPRSIGQLSSRRPVRPPGPLQNDTPVTVEERALLTLLSRDPVETAQAFAELRKRSDQPVDIQEIQIEPLQNSATESAAQSGSAR